MIARPSFWALLRELAGGVVPARWRCALRGHEWTRGFVVVGIRIVRCERCEVSQIDFDTPEAQ